MRRTSCGGCGSPDLFKFLDLGMTPLADEFPAVPDPADLAHYPLNALVCQACWLVQLGEIVPDEVLWRGDYGFYTGASPSSLAYFEDYADSLRERWPGRGLVVEVACNDGTLLQHFDEYDHLGVEPAKGPAEAARARGLDVVDAMFGAETARRIVAECGRAGLVIANNVLAHVADLHDFAEGLRILLADDGVLSVEVQDVGALLLGNGFDLVYHEHRFFFSVETLGHVLASHGLFMTSATRTTAQGGSIRATFGSTGRVWADDAWLRSLDTYSGFAGRVAALSDRLSALVRQEREDGRRVIGYGAPAKSCTLLNFCGLGADSIDVIHDATPAKDGRFAPGTGIPITTDSLPAGENVTALLLSHNYLPGILRRERRFIDETGRFIVPLPVPVVI